MKEVVILIILIMLMLANQKLDQVISVLKIQSCQTSLVGNTYSPDEYKKALTNCANAEVK